MLVTATKALVTACLAGAGRYRGNPAGPDAGGQNYFDPAGVHIAPGDAVRWVQVSGYHSITAYHPKNDNHELRIPQAAQPWDSDILLAQSPRPDATFERVFTVPGVYDYSCKPHELAGMVGRIVVGEPGDGPGTKPFGYAPNEHWKPVPEAARKALPSIAGIVQKGKVRAHDPLTAGRNARAGRGIQWSNAKGVMAWQELSNARSWSPRPTSSTARSSGFANAACLKTSRSATALMT